MGRTISETPAEALEAAPEDLQPLRVLAAEDNPVHQLALKTVLHQVGVDATLVDDGYAVVEAWRTGEWDVILMDVQMPRMDGLTAARLIREAEDSSGRTRTPIVALTADVMAHAFATYREAGMHSVVSKPIDAATLMQAIVECLSDDEAAVAQGLKTNSSFSPSGSAKNTA